MIQQSITFFASDAARWAQKLDRLLAILSDGHWYKASEIARLMASNDRLIRRLADLSDGQIISGQYGYKLTRFATNEEIDHAEAWLLSQAKHMQQRALEIRQCRNRRGAAA
jgi:hypothetical protein